MTKKRKLKPRVIAIAGFAPDSRDQVNEEPDTSEIWAINNAYLFLKRTPNRWFQLHPPDWKRNEGMPAGSYGREPEHLELLKESPCPVYMQVKTPDIPSSVEYPLGDLVERFGRPYFTSTMAYIMALILAEHDDGQNVGEVRVYGINLTTMNEYFRQKACFEYWIGQAEGRGIKVWVPASSGLLKAGLYAREAVRDDVLTMTEERCEAWRQRHLNAMHRAIAGVGIYQELKKLNPGDEEADTQLKERLAEIRIQTEKSMNDANVAFQALREAQHILVALGGFDVPKVEAPAMPPPDLLDFKVVPPASSDSGVKEAVSVGSD